MPVPPRIRAGSPQYEEIEQRPAALPAIAVPAVIPGGMADANFPATSNQQPPPDSREIFVTHPAASPQPPRDALASKLKRTEIQHSPSSIPGRDIVQVLTEIPVGVESGWHIHPGEEVGYIVTGTVEMAIDGRAPLTLHAGDGFLIPPRIPHNARDVGPGTGHMLSTYIVEAGQPLASFTGEPDDR
jgi:quercetin dioxygenase-like cupin family protein